MTCSQCTRPVAPHHHALGLCLSCYHRDYRRRGMPVGPCRDCGTELRLNVGNRLCAACDKRRRRAADPDLRTRERLQRFLQAQLRREADAAAQVAAERRARKNATNARYRARVALAAYWPEVAA